MPARDGSSFQAVQVAARLGLLGRGGEGVGIHRGRQGPRTYACLRPPGATARRAGVRGLVCGHPAHLSRPTTVSPRVKLAKFPPKFPNALQNSGSGSEALRHVGSSRRLRGDSGGLRSQASWDYRGPGSQPDRNPSRGGRQATHSEISEAANSGKRERTRKRERERRKKIFSAQFKSHGKGLQL